jgi:hypothetical protein
VVAFVLIAVKGPAWLKRIGWPWPHWQKDRRMRIGIVIWYVIGLLWCGFSLFTAVSFMRVMAVIEKRTWLLPGAAAALIGICWAASAIWRGSPGRALSRMFAASVLSLGLTWIALRAAMQFANGLQSLGR